MPNDELVHQRDERLSPLGAAHREQRLGRALGNFHDLAHVSRALVVHRPALPGGQRLGLFQHRGVDVRLAGQKLAAGQKLGAAQIGHLVEEDERLVLGPLRHLAHGERAGRIQLGRHDGQRETGVQHKGKARRTSCDEPSVQILRFRQIGDGHPAAHLVDDSTSTSLPDFDAAARARVRMDLMTRP